MANTDNKNILKRMYDRIMEKGGPVGPITQSLVDLYEKDLTLPEENKVNVQFLNKSKNEEQK